MSAEDPALTTSTSVPPYYIDRPDRQTVPLIFASPHSGRDYPPAFVAKAQLDPLSLRRSEDAFVDNLFAAAPSKGASLIRATFPRAFIDANREPFELDQNMFSDHLPDYVNKKSGRVAAGLGTIPRIVSGGQEIYTEKLTFSEAIARIEAYYKPYHSALNELIDEVRKQFDYCVLVDCHSMPSIGSQLDPDAGHGRADFVIGDCFGTTCAPYISDAIENTIANFGYIVARNKPFAGGFTTRNYGKPQDGIHTVQIEINRALYMDEQQIEKSTGFNYVAGQMTELISTLTNFTARDLAAE